MPLLKRAAGRLRFVLFAAALALTPGLTGCFNPEQPACGFSCAGDGLCPSGYSCAADKLCHRDDGQGICELDSGASSPGDAGHDASGGQ